MYRSGGPAGVVTGFQGFVVIIKGPFQYKHLLELVVMGLIR